MQGNRPLKFEELELIKGSFRGKLSKRNAAIFFLGINTGFRVSELLSLKIGDIVEDDGKIKNKITVFKRFMKGGKSNLPQRGRPKKYKKINSRTVMLNNQAKESLKPWLNQLKERGIIHKDDFLFNGLRKGNRPITRVQVWNIFKKVYSDCNLKGPLATHAMRKTFANNVYEHFLNRVAKGEPVDATRATSKALGHADIKSTDKYLSFKEEEIEEAIEAIGFY